MKGKEPINKIYLILGSNIDSIINMERALKMLRSMSTVNCESQWWQTEAVGSDGPDFINVAVGINSDLDQNEFKSQIINSIENSLGRKRTSDKYAPRTIDIDIVIFNQEIHDQKIWKEAFVALPMSDLLPGLIQPETGQTLKEIADQLDRTCCNQVVDH